jgi:hypothetical protein
VPSKNCVGGDERRHVSQHGASEPLPQHREPSALPVGQLQPAPNQLGFQRPILLAKEDDQIALLALQPSEQCREEKLEWNHELSLRQCIARVFRHYALDRLADHLELSDDSVLLHSIDKERRLADGCVGLDVVDCDRGCDRGRRARLSQSADVSSDSRANGWVDALVSQKVDFALEQFLEILLEANEIKE